MPDSYDVIVVGAGPAGSACAYVLASNALSVLLLERGPYPGSKNVFGGTIYSEPMQQLLPAFWQSAPLERAVVNDELWFMDQDAVVKLGFTGLRYAHPPYNKFTVQRSRFDRWMADQAAGAGAEVRTGALARHLVFEQGHLGQKRRVSGVQLDDGEVLLCDVVVLAEGVNAFLVREAGLQDQPEPYMMTLYAVEVLALPAEKIEERFQLEQDEGSTIGIVGYPMAGGVGKAGLFTYKEHISLMVGGYLNQLAEQGHGPYELLQRTKAHPLVSRLLKGAETVQYKAHMIPKGGYKNMPRLYSDHLLVVGDAGLFVSGRRGTDLAALTGIYAAETISLAKARGDFSARALANYQRLLDGTFFLQDIKADRGSLMYYKEHSDSDYLAAGLLTDLAYEFFHVDQKTSGEKQRFMWRTFAEKQLPLKTAADLYQGLQHWGAY